MNGDRDCTNVDEHPRDHHTDGDVGSWFTNTAKLISRIASPPINPLFHAVAAIRKTEDAWNAITAGGLTGGLLAARAGA